MVFYSPNHTVREALFIKKNKDRWLKNQQHPPEDPDEMAKEFTQLVEDLAYAKTFYPSGKVTSFINGEAAKIYLSIYKNRREENNRFINFWKYDLPLTIGRHHGAILFVFLIFLLFFGFGFLAYQENDDFGSMFLPGDYIPETKDRIANGNPFGIYESGDPVLSWIFIMINNVKIALAMFAGGLLLALPCLYLLILNATMVGVFYKLFEMHGLGIDFWRVVFVHGTLEMTGIILAAGAGVILTKSFLFPGTIKRIQSLKRGAKDGVKIIIGMVPVLMLAAFFEGLFTRLYNDLSVLTTIITTLSMLFVLFYFVVYPIILVRKIKPVLNEEDV
jgi:uncharacterized membrane protein SpoIIM required for sporulation